MNRITLPEPCGGGYEYGDEKCPFDNVGGGGAWAASGAPAGNGCGCRWGGGGPRREAGPS
jgi:hypothetical protein